MKYRFSDHCTNTVIETSDTLDKSEVSLVIATLELDKTEHKQ